MSQTKLDESIRREIQLESRSMPEGRSGNVGRVLEQTVVTLAGEVAEESVRRAAEQLGRRLLVVPSVVNNIQSQRTLSDAGIDVSLARTVAVAFGQGLENWY